MPVQPEIFHDAALVLVGHGSSVNDDSSAALHQHVDELKRCACFGQVAAAFWKEEPTIPRVMSGISLPRVFIVPFFISEGYFSEEAVPEALGFKTQQTAMYSRIRQNQGQIQYYCKPVGTHPAMTEVILSRAKSVLDEHPFPRRPRDHEVDLFIAGHGTPRNAESRKSVECQVELLCKRNLYASVHAVFMEEPPRIAECYKLATNQNIVMVPFFLSDGLHVCEDIPILLGQPARQVKERIARGVATWRNPTEHSGRRLWYSSAVGTDPVMLDVILERVKEVANWQADVGN